MAEGTGTKNCIGGIYRWLHLLHIAHKNGGFDWEKRNSPTHNADPPQSLHGKIICFKVDSSQSLSCYHSNQGPSILKHYIEKGNNCI